MWSFMESAKPSVFMKGNTDGIEAVKKGNGLYAFLMESTTIEYVVERECDTTQIGGLLDSKGYGIALPPGSPYRMPISSAILKLQEAGRLHVLKTRLETHYCLFVECYEAINSSRWWKEKRGGGQCAVSLLIYCHFINISSLGIYSGRIEAHSENLSLFLCFQNEDENKAKASELSLANVGGVFVVLLAGMGLACLIAVFEFIWRSRKLAANPLPGEESVCRISLKN